MWTDPCIWRTFALSCVSLTQGGLPQNGSFGSVMLLVPQYSNAFSSVFLLFFGLLGCLMANRRQDGQVIQIYALLMLNSIASFFFNWTGHFGWNVLDESSMIMAITLPCAILFDEMCLPLRPVYLTLIHSYQLVALSFLACGNDVSLLRFPPLICNFAVAMVWSKWSDHKNSEPLVLLKAGATLSLLTAAIWIASESFDLPWMHGRVFANAGVAYGIHLILCFVCWVRADNEGFAPLIMRKWRIPYSVAYEIITFTDNDLAVWSSGTYQDQV